MLKYEKEKKQRAEKWLYISKGIKITQTAGVRRIGDTPNAEYTTIQRKAGRERDGHKRPTGWPRGAVICSAVFLTFCTALICHTAACVSEVFDLLPAREPQAHSCAACPQPLRCTHRSAPYTCAVAFHRVPVHAWDPFYNLYHRVPFVLSRARPAHMVI